MKTDYQRHLECAISAARSAGELLRDEFHRPGGPRGSGSHAEADDQAEALIREDLTHAFPAIGIRGEELGYQLGSDPDAHLWLVDPNDGTVSYLNGFRGSAVSIALLRNGVPILGVVYAYGAPTDAGDLIAWAEGCGPIQRNGTACPPRKPWATTLDCDGIIITSQHSDHNSQANATIVAPARYWAMTSLAYRLALVAVGGGELAVSLNGAVGWDYAAGHALLRAVDGVFINNQGAPITYTKTGESSAGGDCFGGSPALAAVLAAKNWRAVYQKSPASDNTYSLYWPKRGEAIRDADLLARAQGCLMGQFVGDALGEMVEFQSKSSIARKYPEGVRDIADGGSWNTIAGQPTDDSELALMLARDIVAQGKFTPQAVAKAYAYWLSSHPFDVGHTTRSALSSAAHALANGNDVLTAARNAANPSSQANGALMRVSPLAIYGHKAAPERLAQWAREDAQLTHPNTICQDASAVYVVAIQHALTTGAAAQDVYEFACKWARANHLHADVLTTLAAAQTNPPDFETNEGWVRVALQNAFRQLLRAKSFDEGLVDTVNQGGDTDTNGAIVGALLGAVYGLPNIPPRWQSRVVTCRPIQGMPGVHHPRPACFWPVDVLMLAEKLLVCGR